MVGHNYYYPHADRHSSNNSNEDVLLTLRAMIGQEERYAVLDYLSSQHEEDHLMLPVMPSESSTSERNNSISNINRRSSPSSEHSPSANAAVPARRDLIDSDCRTILVEWAYRVVDHFHIGREVVAYAMNYVDRFCSHHFTSSDRLLDKNSYKLIVTSSLYLALKLHHEGERAHQKCFESWHYQYYNNRSSPGLVSPTVDYDGDDSDGHGHPSNRTFGEGMSSRLTTILPYLTRGEHTQAHLDRFETILIQTMGFYLHPPLAACFVEQYMHVLQMENSSSGSSRFLEDVQGDLCHEANIFVDLSVAEYDAATVRPSLIALAALLNAMTLLERRQQQEDDESSRSTLLFQSLRSSLLEKLVPSSQEEQYQAAAAVVPLVPEVEQGRQAPSPPFSSASRDMVSNNTVASVSCCPILKNQDDIQDLKNIQMLLWELRFDSSEEGYESPVNDPAAAAMDVEDETRQDSVAAGRAGTVTSGHNHKSNHGSSSGSDNDEDDDDDGEDMFPRLSPTSTTQLL